MLIIWLLPEVRQLQLLLLSTDYKKSFKKQKIFQKSIDKCFLLWYNIKRAVRDAAMAQLVEHMLGKHEVISSTLISSSNAQTLESTDSRVFIF